MQRSAVAAPRSSCRTCNRALQLLAEFLVQVGAMERRLADWAAEMRELGDEMAERIREQEVTDIIEFDDEGEFEEFYKALRATVGAHALRGCYLPLEAAAEVMRRGQA